MHEKLQRIYGIAEQERKSLFNLVKSNQYAVQKQENNKWSINQILAHLIISEELSLAYMKKKSLGIDHAGDTGFWENIKIQLLIISQRLPLKYKAPRVLGEDAPPHLTIEDVETKWDRSRQDLASFLESFQDNTLYKKIYKHPVAGRLNILQAITFFREHVSHHIPQIKRQLA